MILKITKIFYFLILSIALSNIIIAQDSTKTKKNENGKHQTNKFVDNNGDGYNDNAPDHDGDGIPNGLDSDFIKFKKRQNMEYVDANGDGINDNLMFRGKRNNKINQSMKMNIKPQDGSNINNNNGKKKGRGTGKGRGNG